MSLLSPGSRYYLLEDIQQHMSSTKPAVDLGAFSNTIWMDCIHACRPSSYRECKCTKDDNSSRDGFPNLEGHGRQSERCKMGTPNTCLSAKLASQSCSVSLNLSVTHALSNSSTGGRLSCL